MNYIQYIIVKDWFITNPFCIVGNNMIVDAQIDEEDHMASFLILEWLDE